MTYSTTEIDLTVYLGNPISLPSAFLCDSMKHILGDINISKTTVSDAAQQEIVSENVWLYFVLQHLSPHLEIQ
jgi:ssRNA-specific RNase YbeY (16S rRNA maturation enzyme)